MRGYFGIGCEGISKPRNLGGLLRTAHAFGASFGFTIAADVTEPDFGPADTSDAGLSLPLYHYARLDDLDLPEGCQLVGVELIEAAVPLPSFRHPHRAAYVLGPERGSLSPALVARCAHLVRIPTRFSINLAVAGALVMYDRMLSLGRFAERPVGTGGPREALPAPVFGRPIRRKPHPPPGGRDPG